MKLIFRWTDLYRLVVLALAYALLAKGALSFFSANGVVSIVWPSSGLALAVLLIGGKKYWPGIFIGALAGNILQGSSAGISIFIATGNTLEALACVWLLDRIHRFNSDLTQPRDFLWLGITGALGSCVSALIGVGTLLLAGILTKQAVAHNLLQWWQGDALGIILVTPLILVWRHLPHGWLSRKRMVETIVCFGLAFFAGQIIFLGWFHEFFGTTARGFWVFVFVVWGAVHFGRHGALLIIGMTAIQMLLGMVLEVGGAATNQVPVGLLNFWLYMLAVTMVGVLMALVLDGRNKLELERLSQIRYLDSMESINRVSIIAQTVEEMLSGVLDEALKIFDADRAWFLYPCDPDATFWDIPMERTRPEWPGGFALGKTMPMIPEAKDLFESLLADDECIQYGPMATLPVPAPVAEQFSIKSQMAIALRPKVGKPWVMGLHHCSEAHFYDADDQSIFKGIAHRVSDSLSSFAALKERRENEERSLSLFQNAPVGLFHSLPTGQILLANQALAMMLGYVSAEQLIAAITDIGAQIYVAKKKRAQIIKAVMKQDGWVQEEADLRCKDGNIITTNIIMRKVLDPESTVAYLEGFIQNITERKQAEMALADSERRLRFLNDLGNATHALHEPKDIIATVARLLGSHLGASRCAYAEVDTDGDGFTIPHDYTEGCTSIVGDYQLSLFGSRAVSELRAGRTLAIGDVDAELSPSEGRDMFNAIEIKAVICCPLVKQGILRAMMAVHQTTARKWTPDEVSLVEEVVERCWAIIERARAEKERNRAEAIAKDRGQRLLTIIETEPECVKVVDAKGNLLEMNAAGLAMLEAASLEEAQQHSLIEFILADYRDAFRKLHKRVIGGESGTLKFEVLGLKGARRWLETHAAPMRNEVGKVTSLLGVTRDITEHKRSEERILRLSHLYQALSEVNQAIVRMDQQAELFPLVCRCAVEFGGMKMAWIGQLDETSGIITPVASYGDSTGYLDNIHISSHADSVEGRGPTGTAARENRSVIVNDYLSDPTTAPWHAQAVKFGWVSAASFPIQRDSRPFAVLSVYHAEINAFDEESISLLKEMSMDISFALDNFDRETQRKAAEESMRLAASVYDTSTEGIMITDADNRIIAVNPAFVTITGYPKEEVIGKNPSIFSSSQHGEAFYEAMWQSINTSGHWQGEVWDKRKNGEIFPRWLTISTIFNEDDTVQRRVIMFTDISQKKEAEQLIWRQANFDALTALPNRQMFYDRLDQDIKKAHRAGRPLALMFIDLDRFKEINDTLGHDKGDILLKEAAHRLSSCVRETDTVARLGGDEFTVILSELDDSGNIERVAQNILHKLAEPFHLGDEVAYISASIGITLYPEDATGIETLLKNADQAMYAAKDLGRNRYSYFTPSMQLVAQTRMQISNDLRSALTNHQFWIAYQPIVELATGSIHKAEALIRWQHPTRGLVSPAAFIPIAEDTGLIIDIGDWVFCEAAQQAKRWRALLHPAFQISVNKSPVQFQNGSQSHLIWYDYLRQLGLPGQSIAVEITEGLLLEASTLVTDRLLEFRNAGIQISLDDFGTGYSALSYLKKFDIDYLKIDQSFTRNLASGSDDMALCEAIIVLSHKLNMKVIAEGVETLEQRDLLIAAGCDYGQGYFFSRPIPANEFEVLMKKA